MSTLWTHSLRYFSSEARSGNWPKRFRADRAPEALKGAVDPVVVGLTHDGRQRMLADIGQDDAAVLGDDGLPGRVVALRDRPLEHLEAIGILPRLAAQETLGFLSASAG